MNLDDGYYHDGMMIWFKGFCTKGYMLAAPDLLNSSSEMLHEQEDNLRGLLSSLPDNCKVQFSWGCNSDYRDVLDHYYDDTMKLAKEEWSFTTRMERYERYKKKMDAGDLRREKLFLYITLPLGSAARPKPADLNTSNVKAMRAFFDNVQHMIKLHLSACGIKAMDETDYYMNHLCFFNPCADNILGDNLSGYDPEKTILENTYRSDVLGNTPTSEEPFSMFFDSHYHSIMVMSRAPSFTYMGQIFILTSLPFLNYRITINLEYQPIEKEISNTERIIKRLSGEFNADPSKQGHVESIKQARQKIANLSDGSLKPMKFELYIHIWGIDKTEVQTKTAAIKAAIKKMDSADLTEASLDTQAIGMFARTIPGSGVNHPYNYYKLYCESNYIAALIPYSSTFRAFEKAEALYDGNNNNLVGLVNFLGTTPQHCAVFGSSGSGKSALMCDLLSQTEPYYGFTAIIEEGVSYGIYTLAYGQTPLIIHPEADITINYLDTSQLPLGPRQIGTATAFAGQMAGKSGNEERDNFRHGLLQYFITELYQSSADDWRLKNPELFLEAASLARASQRYLEMIMPPGSSLQEAYFEYRDKRNDLKDEYEDHTPEELSNYILDPRTAEHAMNFCFIFYQAEDYPTHSDLCQYIMIFDDPSRMSREDQKTLIALMEVWQAGGSYGTLFDGPSNVTIKDKIAHFELGYIDESDERLKRMVSFLLTNTIRNHILTLPRSTRKRIIFEEAGRFMNIPGGEKMISEGYKQMRKFNCWIVAITQDFDQFKGTSLATTILNNSRQFIILKMQDRNDLANLCDADRGGINVPKVTQERVLSYPTPAELKADACYSSFCYIHNLVHPYIGTCRNYCSEIMLYCSASSGSDFDQRMRDIKSTKHESITDAILELI